MTESVAGALIGEKGSCLYKWIKNVTEICLNALYPRCCPLCHKVLKEPSRLLCPSCEKVQKPVSGPRCMRCSKPVSQDREYCKDCEKTERSFDEGKGIYFYDERMRTSIVRYKYYGRRQYGEFFARAMCVYGKQEIERWRPDLIVPVPLHWRKQRSRGFNQAEDLSCRIGAFYHIPVAAELVVKVHSTKSQKKLNKAQRRKNLKHVFVCREPIKARCVLVIDDVYTTGATMDAMAACLKEQGAQTVCFLTLCIGKG